jgi:drug/metabolite transporter (DMT)-like permease
VKRWVGITIALFVTFLWSTSYILNKLAFAEGIRPLTLAGLRYLLAAVTLFGLRSLIAKRSVAQAPTTAPPSAWQYIGLGIAGYLVAQGLQYWGQYFVTPTQSSMMLSVGNTLLVLLIGWFSLRERPGVVQSVGLLVALTGSVLYYYPFGLAADHLFGLAMLLCSGLGYAIQLTANRSLLQRQAAGPFDLTLYPMAVGAATMLVLGFLLEPWPGITTKLLGLLLWLGPINGALAFLLWTISQRALQAFESSALNNSMLLQIAALDALLLGREIDPKGLFALVLVAAGILTVQLAARGGTTDRSLHLTRRQRQGP